RWASGAVTPEEMMEHPSRVCTALLARLPGPFDVVLSSCLLTQLQWAALNVLTDAHQLFEAVREVATLTHLRALVALTARGGRALLATDVASNVDQPLERLTQRPPREVLRAIVDEGH